MSKTLNFDKFLSEKTNETLDVTVYGSTYKIPMKIPAIVPVMMARAEESLDESESSRMIFRAADALFGKSAVDKMCENGISGAELVDLVQRTFAVINGKEMVDEEAQELTDEDSHVAARRGKSAKK